MNEDRMLQILRSLRPPEAPAADDERGKEAPHATGAAARAPAAAGASLPDLRSPGSRRPEAAGRIELRVEEIGIFFLAAVVLVVLAFLMGWYGRELAGPTEHRSADGEKSAGAPKASIVPLGTPAAQDLGDRRSEVRSLDQVPRQTFAILAVRFPPGGEAEAEDHRRLLEERGYRPAWIRRTTQGVELCAGRFETPADALAINWLPRIQRLHAVYSSAQIVRIPQE